MSVSMNENTEVVVAGDEVVCRTSGIPYLKSGTAYKVEASLTRGEPGKSPLMEIEVRCEDGLYRWINRGHFY